MTFHVFNYLACTSVIGRKCEWNLCCEWLVIQFLSVVSGICALLEEKSFYHFLTVDLFFHFHFIIVFCAVAYVSAIWRIYSIKELQRSFWKFWFRGSANNNWIDHFPGMLRTYFQQAFVLFFHKIFATNYQMRANKTNLFGMDLIVGTFDLN